MPRLYDRQMSTVTQDVTMVLLALETRTRESQLITQRCRFTVPIVVYIYAVVLCNEYRTCGDGAIQPCV
ncbi:hypothetical protein T08_1978 [Trichinella sp. T8]|nr:hypothetical protein T08_1978 [Trichinella sp. T8]